MMEYLGEYRQILLHLLESASLRDYAGYSKFDALNSPLIDFLSFGNSWLKFLFTQTVNRMPVNIRPLLGVRVSRNPKGIALFARSYLNLFQLTGDESFLSEALSLIRWLLENPSPESDNLCWGYNFEWQNSIFLQKRNQPNVVVSIFVGRALIHAYSITGDREYLEHACSVLRFLLEDVPVLQASSDEMAISYVVSCNKTVVLNINSIAGAFISIMWRETGDDSLKETAVKLLNHTEHRITEYGAWFYTDPPSSSPIQHDNYHTGFILDSFMDFYQATSDDRYINTWRNGLDFYRRNLFEDDGTPRWMSHRKYPLDIHGAAQGIITFARASGFFPNSLDMANRIADWAVSSLYRAKTGDFAYRIGRLFKWNYSLMRWCNAWMSMALSELDTACHKESRNRTGRQDDLPSESGIC